MRVLITGGLGYLGARLADYLLQQGHEVAIGSRNKIKEIRFPLKEAIPVCMDWNDISSLQSATKGRDIVVHLAGINAQDSYLNPVAALYANGVLSAEMLSASIKQGVTRFIYISTVHVYKSPLIGDFDEHSPARNLHPYATSKLAGENAVLFANQMKMIEGVVLRLANGSGYPLFPDTDCWHLVVNDLCRQAVEKKELIVHSDASVERDFIALSNVCLGIEHFMKISKDFIDNESFNLGSGESKSLQCIAGIVAEQCHELTSYRPKIYFNKKDSADSSKDTLNISIDKARKTGLNLKNNIVDEINKTLRYCVDNFC